MTLPSPPSERRLFGAIEAGGTKFVCAVASGPQHILERAVFPTRNPVQTLDQVCGFFREASARQGALAGLGIGSFGPVDIDPASAAYGHILDTPKPAWSGTDVLGILERELGVEAVIDTDVNCALLGEAHFGAGRSIANLVYITIGTGIGAGIMINRRVVYGASHPEIGHVLVPKHPNDKDFPGNCPFHGDACIEGLVSGPAIEARFGVQASELPVDHPAWELIADYIGSLCCNLLLTVAPDRIILGGGVMQQAHLHPLVRQALGRKLNGYIRPGKNLLPGQAFIVPPELGNRSGIEGALMLVEQRLLRTEAVKA